MIYLSNQQRFYPQLGIESLRALALYGNPLKTIRPGIIQQVSLQSSLQSWTFKDRLNFWMEGEMVTHL